MHNIGLDTAPSSVQALAIARAPGPARNRLCSCEETRRIFDEHLLHPVLNSFALRIPLALMSAGFVITTEIATTLSALRRSAIHRERASRLKAVLSSIFAKVVVLLASSSGLQCES